MNDTHKHLADVWTTLVRWEQDEKKELIVEIERLTAALDAVPRPVQMPHRTQFRPIGKLEDLNTRLRGWRETYMEVVNERGRLEEIRKDFPRLGEDE